jgi:hypothetical protein
MPAERTLPPGDLQRPHDWLRTVSRVAGGAELSPATRGVRNSHALYSDTNANSYANEDTYAYAIVASKAKQGAAAAVPTAPQGVRGSTMRERAWSLGAVAIKAQLASFVKLPSTLQGKIAKTFRSFLAFFGNFASASHGHEKEIAILDHASDGAHEFLVTQKELIRVRL